MGARHHSCVVSDLNAVPQFLRRDTHRVEAVWHVHATRVSDRLSDSVRCRDDFVSNFRGNVSPVRGEVTSEARMADALCLRTQVDSVKTLQHFHARPILSRANIPPQSCNAAGTAGELSLQLGEQSLGDIELTHAPQSTANVFEQAAIERGSLYEKRKGGADSPGRNTRFMDALDVAIPYTAPLRTQSAEVAGDEELGAV
jgi:hypothetical protein